MFRGTKRYSFKILAVSTVVIASSFLLFNTLSQKILVEPGSHAQGNFAYAIYGQAMGGTGYYRAITDIGYDPSLVYKKTLEAIFKTSPKPGDRNIQSVSGFSLAWVPDPHSNRPLEKNGMVGHAPMVFHPLSLHLGTYQGDSNLAATGFFLHTPHRARDFSLNSVSTPIDGGARFYTNVAPFLLVLPAFGLGDIVSRRINEPVDDDIGLSRSLVWVTGISLALVVLTPLVFKLFP